MGLFTAHYERVEERCGRYLYLTLASRLSCAARCDKWISQISCSLCTSSETACLFPNLSRVSKRPYWRFTSQTMFSVTRFGSADYEAEFTGFHKEDTWFL